LSRAWMLKSDTTNDVYVLAMSKAELGAAPDET
jgi:hypothetical protein